jgi:hypothetical protein
MKLELHKKYLVKANIRPEYNGRAVKESVLPLQDKEFVVRAGWIQDEQDTYPNEYALLFEDIEMTNTYGIGWISSGDVIIKEEFKR